MNTTLSFLILLVVAGLTIRLLTYAWQVYRADRAGTRWVDPEGDLWVLEPDGRWRWHAGGHTPTACTATTAELTRWYGGQGSTSPLPERNTR